MTPDNRIILTRLLYSALLFVAFFTMESPLDDLIIILMLVYLILLQLTAYFLPQKAIRAVSLVISLGILLYLSYHSPSFLPFFLFPWLLEIARSDHHGHAVAYLVLAGASIAGMAITYNFPLSLHDIGLLLIVVALLAALRYTQDQVQTMDEQVYALSKSNVDLESEKKQTQVHVEQLRELFTLEERNRISRDLHDSIGHSLSAIRIQLEAIAQIAPQDGEKAAGMARRLAGFTEEGLQKLRIVLHQMKPAQYSDQALLLRLTEIGEDFSAMSGMTIRITSSAFRYTAPPAHDQLIQLALQEFLSNAHRHGNATQVNVHLHYTKEGLTLTMKDNGKGTAHISKNIGLTGAEERAQKEGGHVHITSAPGAGFMTQIKLPRGESHD